MGYEADHQEIDLTNGRSLYVMRSTIDAEHPLWVFRFEHGGLAITVPMTDDNVQDLFTALKSMRHRASNLSSV